MMRDILKCESSNELITQLLIFRSSTIGITQMLITMHEASRYHARLNSELI